MGKESKVSHYRAILPQRVKARIESSEEGLWAYLSTDDGRLKNCYTQGSNMTDLLGMINDAIQTYFEVPDEYKKDVGYYIPLSAHHIKLEEMFAKLLAIERQASVEGESEETLTLKSAELQIC